MAARRCAAEFRRQHPRYIHLLQLAVHPTRQGRGLGEACRQQERAWEGCWVGNRRQGGRGKQGPAEPILR